MQTDINHYVTKVRIEKASFRQTLDPISKNILRRQNPLELVFEDILTFDAEYSIVGSLLKEIDVGKKDIGSEPIKKAPRPPDLDASLRAILDKLKNRPDSKGDDDHFNLWPPPSPPRPPSSGPQPPRPQLGPSPATPFCPPPSVKFLEPFQQPTAQPRRTPPLKPKGFIGIPPAPSTPPLSPSDSFLLGPSARSVSPTTRLLTPTAPPLSPPPLTPSNNLYGSQTQTLTREKEEMKNAVQIKLNNEIYELHNDPPKHVLGDGLANIFEPNVEDI